MKKIIEAIKRLLAQMVNLAIEAKEPIDFEQKEPEKQPFQAQKEQKKQDAQPKPKKPMKEKEPMPNTLLGKIESVDIERGNTVITIECEIPLHSLLVVEYNGFKFYFNQKGFKTAKESGTSNWGNGTQKKLTRLSELIGLQAWIVNDPKVKSDVSQAACLL